MLCDVLNAVAHGFPDLCGPWEQTSLVMFSIQKTENVKEKRRKEGSAQRYEYAFPGRWLRWKQEPFIPGKSDLDAWPGPADCGVLQTRWEA